VGATGSPGGCATGAFGSALTPSTRSTDSSVTIEGDDRGLGLDLSLLYAVSDQTRFGVTYRQGVDFTLLGEADFDQSQACQNNAGCSGALTASEGDIAADVELPDTVTLSFSHEFGAGWAIHSDLAWTEWSTLQQLEVVNTDNGRTIDTLELNYDDTVRYALGASYNTRGRSLWRFGVAHDEAPQTAEEFTTPRIPDEDRTWLSIGYRHELSDSASIDVGYAHLFTDDIEIDNTAQGNRLQGRFDASIDIIGVQGNWTF
jgi:long-chain fatty acid transport protein